MQGKYAANKGIYWAIVTLGREAVRFHCHWYHRTKLLMKIPTFSTVDCNENDVLFLTSNGVSCDVVHWV